MPIEPTFLLGAGCQKGGTSWLHDFLARSPACAPGFAKEATVFDVLDVPEHTWRRTRTFEQAPDALARLSRGEPADPRALHRAAMMADPAIYFDYYAHLARGAGKSFTMDLTPGYALLPGSRFAQIRTEFAARGLRTRVVFLLRDPVDRIWSQVRMHLRSRGKSGPDGPRRPHPRSEPELVLERYQRPSVELRTRYERTLTALDQAFDPTDVHLELYERLFTPASIDRVCEFVGIAPHAPDFDRLVNASPRQSATLPDDVVSAVAHYYAETYAAVAARLGVADMQQWWPSARFLGAGG